MKMRKLDLGKEWEMNSKYPGCYFSVKTIDEMKLEPKFDETVKELQNQLNKYLKEKSNAGLSET